MVRRDPRVAGLEADFPPVLARVGRADRFEACRRAGGATARLGGSCGEIRELWDFLVEMHEPAARTRRPAAMSGKRASSSRTTR